MSPTVQGRANRGSQKWIQVLVNSHIDLFKEKLTGILSPEEDIIPVSPLVKYDFKEYRDEEFIKQLGLNLSKFRLDLFWPSKGPSWDALARTTNGKVILVEAKSHIAEIISEPCGAKGQLSISKIRGSLEATKSYLGIRSQSDWMTCFYQYANRLAHLYLLRVLNGIDAYMVFLYFLNDREQCGPSKEKDWNQAIRRIESSLGIEGKHNLSDYVHKVFIDVRELQQ